MTKLNEKDFVLEQLIPLFQKLGFQHTRWTHGKDEYGRDIIFHDIDRFGIQRTYGAQVKVGDISGAAGKQIDKIIAQIDDALQMPYLDILHGEKKYIIGLYVIISGKFKRNAKEKIREKCRGKPIFFLEGEDLKNIEGNLNTRKSDSYRELERLLREAMAASRRDDMDILDQKLHEIDLLEECSLQDKVNALNRLGLEIPLNSDKGTQILIDHILWQTAGWDSQGIVDLMCGIDIGKILLESITSTLWEIGATAIEYGRDKKTVENINGAIIQIRDIATNIGATQASKSCKAALLDLQQRIVNENRDDLRGLIK